MLSAPQIIAQEQAQRVIQRLVHRSGPGVVRLHIRRLQLGDGQQQRDMLALQATQRQPKRGGPLAY
jgi:hypothetical protein